MKNRYKVSPEKFKKLYFYRFLWIQVWFGFSLAWIIAFAYLPLKTALDDSVTIALFIMAGVGAIAWFYSLGWYAEKTHIRNKASIIISDEGFLYKTEKVKPIKPKHADLYRIYVYRASIISGLTIGKRHITVYGDIVMERYDEPDIHTIADANRYSRIKIPNFFEAPCIDDLQTLTTKASRNPLSID